MYSSHCTIINGTIYWVSHSTVSHYNLFLRNIIVYYERTSCTRFLLYHLVWKDFLKTGSWNFIFEKKKSVPKFFRSFSLKHSLSSSPTLASVYGSISLPSVEVPIDNDLPSDYSTLEKIIIVTKYIDNCNRKEYYFCTLKSTKSVFSTSVIFLY